MNFLHNVLIGIRAGLPLLYSIRLAMLVRGAEDALRRCGK
jgi:hypothetical protein